MVRRDNRAPWAGLEAFLHKELVTIYSQVVHQPSGIRRFWFGVSVLSSLRPVLRNGNPPLKFLGNAITGERIRQRPTPRHLCRRTTEIATESSRLGNCTAKRSAFCFAG